MARTLHPFLLLAAFLSPAVLVCLAAGPPPGLRPAQDQEASAAQAVPARAEPDPVAPPFLAPEFHRGRRAELMRRVASGVILVRGSAEPPDHKPLIQNHEFFYLTGVQEPDCELVLLPESGQEILLVPPRSRFTEIWEGTRLYPGEKAAEATGIPRVESNRTLRRLLEESLEGAEEKVLHLLFTPESRRAGTRAQATRASQRRARDAFDGRGTRADALRAALGDMFPQAELRDLSRVLDEMRVVKTEEEIALLRHASRVAALGINEAMRNCRPGRYEWQLAAAADLVFQNMGSQAVSYGAIVGSGPNALVLHYKTNDRVIQPGELVLMDFAPDTGGYVSDLTRTFPSDGRFTEEQRRIYLDVLAAQEAMIAAVRPGTSFPELTRIGNRLLEERGYRPGLDIRHGPCHFVGLAVHDVGGFTRRLEPGMVFTVEPGVYIEEKKTGVRIEDVVLVTEDGCEVLTADSPRDPDAIEALMKERGVLERGRW